MEKSPLEKAVARGKRRARKFNSKKEAEAEAQRRADEKAAKERRARARTWVSEVFWSILSDRIAEGKTEPAGYLNEEYWVRELEGNVHVFSLRAGAPMCTDDFPEDIVEEIANELHRQEGMSVKYSAPSGHDPDLGSWRNHILQIAFVYGKR